MRPLISFLAFGVLTVAILTACNSAEWKNAKELPASSAPTPGDGVRRVTVAELKNLIDRNEVLVIDVRNQVSYDAGHIPGSRLIPEVEVKNHAAGMPKDKLVVTYCS